MLAGGVQRAAASIKTQGLSSPLAHAHNQSVPAPLVKGSGPLELVFRQRLDRQDPGSFSIQLSCNSAATRRRPGMYSCRLTRPARLCSTDSGAEEHLQPYGPARAAASAAAAADAADAADAAAAVGSRMSPRLPLRRLPHAYPRSASPPPPHPLYQSAPTHTAWHSCLPVGAHEQTNWCTPRAPREHPVPGSLGAREEREAPGRRTAEQVQEGGS